MKVSTIIFIGLYKKKKNENNKNCYYTYIFSFFPIIKKITKYNLLIKFISYFNNQTKVFGEKIANRQKKSNNNKNIPKIIIIKPIYYIPYVRIV